MIPSISISTPVGVVPRSVPASIAYEPALRCRFSDPLLAFVIVFAAVAPSALVTAFDPNAVKSSLRL